MRLLLCEDEVSLCKALKIILGKNNHSIDCVYNGKEAVEYLRADNYDAVIMDVMMPVMDGITALKKIRAGGSRIPVLMLTAKAEIDDKVLGLDSGADYYLTKPFDTKELLAALRAITRTAAQTPDTKIAYGNITLDRATFELYSQHGSFHLANKEFQMMEMLLANPHNIIYTERFMERIWGFDSDTEINVVWVYVSYLRKKLSALGADVTIKASRNIGYSLEKTNDKKIKN